MNQEKFEKVLDKACPPVEIKKASGKILKATHQGILRIGERELACYVLEDGTRVISQKGLFKAIERPQTGTNPYKKSLPPFLTANNLDPFINQEILTRSFPVQFEPLLKNLGQIGLGYKAEFLVSVCEVFLKARDANALHKTQEKTAKICEILVRSLANVGVIALVDEATGYQYERRRNALQEILDQFIAKELRAWTKTFPDEFYELIFKLKGWKFTASGIKKRPGVVGKMTNDIIYDRLAPGVLKELQRITPRDTKGRLKHQYHRRLTDDIGHPKLREHIASIIALMRASNSWKGFQGLLIRAFPRYGDQMKLGLEDQTA